MEAKNQAILEAIDAAKKDIDTFVKKNGINERQRYSYAKFEDYIANIELSLKNHGLLLISDITDVKDGEPRPTSSNSLQYPVRVTMKLTLHHVLSQQRISITVFGDGIDSGDKAIYKAITGARKYGVSMLFNLATSDDPENDSSENHSNKKSSNTQQKPIAPAERIQQVANQALQGSQSNANKLVEQLRNAKTLPQLQNIFEKLIKSSPEWKNPELKALLTKEKDSKKAELSQPQQH